MAAGWWGTSPDESAPVITAADVNVAADDNFAADDLQAVLSGLADRIKTVEDDIAALPGE